MSDSIEKRALQWSVGDDTGSSSKAIVAYMTGSKPRDAAHSYPSDAGDLGRCLRLLDLIPEWKPRMVQMGELSPQWAALVDHWEELDRLQRMDGKVYERMTALLRPAEDKDPAIVRIGDGMTMRIRR